MTLFALVLVLTAGFFHASWNLLAKRAGADASGPAFVWLTNALSALLLAPFAAAVVFLQDPRVGALGLLFMFGTGVLHIGYFLSLQAGYEVGDLSLVYPLARGTGPLLSSAAAIALFGERPGAVAVAGALLIAGGVFLLAWDPKGSAGSSARRLGVFYGLLTGAFIASYTLWDKYAVSALLLSPVLYLWACGLVEVALLAPVALRKRGAVGAVWRRRRLETVGVAVLSPLSYFLVLMALVFAPVSHVAPAREVGILIGAAMGGRLLEEGGTKRRLVAAAAMVAGIVALAVG